MYYAHNKSVILEDDDDDNDEEHVSNNSAVKNLIKSPLASILFVFSMTSCRAHHNIIWLPQVVSLIDQMYFMTGYTMTFSLAKIWLTLWMLVYLPT